MSPSLESAMLALALTYWLLFSRHVHYFLKNTDVIFDQQIEEADSMKNTNTHELITIIVNAGFEAAQKLKVKRIVMGECGHAFRSVYDVGNRWLVASWMRQCSGVKTSSGPPRARSPPSPRRPRPRS